MVCLSFDSIHCKLCHLLIKESRLLVLYAQLLIYGCNDTLHLSESEHTTEE